MNKLCTVLCILCTLSTQADTWTQKANFSGTARHAATGFFLNGKGYIGTGGTFSIRKQDFWQWDPTTNAWTQKADLAVSQGRSGSVGFAIGDYGYISTGYDNGYQNDLWQYDPSGNSWTQKSDAGTIGRHYAVAFELNGYGYLGTGNKNFAMQDFWQYDPTTNTWTQKADFGGSARSSAAGFSVNGKGYLGTGFGTSNALSDFWEYDPSANTWAQKAVFGGGARSDAVGFAACGKGFLTTGVGSSVDKNDIWEYDPIVNTWTQKTSLPGSARENAVAFSDGTKGYVGTGTNIFSEFSDFWEYTPDCTLLPIELTSFSAVQKGSVIQINWTTESEFSNDYFTLEKSLDGSHFETLVVIKGAGNSSSQLNYIVEDDHPFTGENYYRLLQTDEDGKFTYSNIILCTATGENMMRVLGVIPNPVLSDALINLDLSESDNLHVTLFDTEGTLVYDQSFSLNQGVQQLNIHLAALSGGIYLMKVQCEYGTYSQKLIKLN
ncbi:MAG: kelch repeat-containing protein [Chitinophagales bacterium]